MKFLFFGQLMVHGGFHKQGKNYVYISSNLSHTSRHKSLQLPSAIHSPNLHDPLQTLGVTASTADCAYRALAAWERGERGARPTCLRSRQMWPGGPHRIICFIFQTFGNRLVLHSALLPETFWEKKQ